MSVFKRQYRRYDGPTTGRNEIFLALMRYAASDLWSSRITNIICVLCIVPMLISMFVIYVANNDVIRMLLSNGHNATPTLAIDERFFFGMLQAQGWPALVLTAWIGPKIIAGDLANDALPTILSHPISRVEYVLSKVMVLVGFLSAVTWVPMVVLFLFASYVAPTPWMWQHVHILIGSLVGFAVWVVLLSLLSLAVSSWVKWRIVATGLLFAAVFVPAGMGTVFNAVMRTHWGDLVNIPLMISTLWRRLVQASIPQVFMGRELPTMAIVISLSCISVFCVMALNARIRAREVVRG